MTTMSDVENAVTNVVEKFRLGIEGPGSDLLERLMALFEYVITSMQGVEFNAEQDLQLLVAIVRAMERGDYLYIADLMEYELPDTKLWDLTKSTITQGRSEDLKLFNLKI